jgi:fatty acid desaturase
MRRKLLRDLTGRTGFRDTLTKLSAFDLRKNWSWLAFHLGLLAVLTACGAPWAYLLWWAAEIFVLPLLSRLRQIGEHGVATNRSSNDSRKNTSTTLVSPLERLFVAPNFVNYHLEHHEFATVPAYRLRKLHLTLRERGYHDGFDCISRGYINVLKRAVQ